MSAADEPTDAADRWTRAASERATRERGRRTLAKLLDAALAEFAAYGYHGARVARVAKRAGTSHGSFYVYFRGKDDLLLAVYRDLQAGDERLIADLPPFEDTPDGVRALRDWVRRACRRLQEQAPLRAAIFDAISGESDPEITAAVFGNLDRSVGAIADRIRATGSPGLEPGVAALCIHNLLDAANRAMARGQLMVGTDELVEGIVEFVQRSLFGAGAVVPPGNTAPDPVTGT